MSIKWGRAVGRYADYDGRRMARDAEAQAHHHSRAARRKSSASASGFENKMRHKRYRKSQETVRRP